MNFGSVCSGIEAASQAWDGLGWSASWLAEIEKFPSAVLNYHYPDVPNLGDMTTIAERITSGEIEAPEVLVGGTPCQSFSVAGARQGLNDGRGQLTISFMELANAIDAKRISEGKQPCIIVWENVPGVLSDKTNAFGCFLGGLAGEECELQPSGKRWSNAGCVFGHQRKIAWRILDAQYFGVAQRRRRVFVIASAREGFNPAEVLFEPKSLSGNPQTSRSSRKGSTAETSTGVTGSGKDIFPTALANCGTKQWLGNQEALSGDYHILEPIAYALDSLASSSMKSANPNSGCNEVPISKTIDTSGLNPSCNQGGNAVVGSFEPIVISTKQQSLNCTEGLANTLGKGDYKEPQAVMTYGIQANTIDRQPHNGGNGLGFAEEISPTLTKTDRHAVAAFQQNTRDEVRYIGGDGQIVGALAANAGMKQTNYIHETEYQLFEPRSADGVPRLHGDICPTLNTMKGGQREPCVQIASQVRRLTPVECEALQGFPKNYTNVPYNGKPDSPDTKRYQALGNSMAVPCMVWLGQRIQEHLK